MASPHLFITSQCWGSDLLQELFGSLAHRAPRLTCIINFGSLPHAQDLARLVGLWGTIVRVAHDVEGTWDPHATAIYIRKGCNATRAHACVRRMRRWLAAAARDAEAAGTVGESPWRAPHPETSAPE